MRAAKLARSGASGVKNGAQHHHENNMK